MGSVLVFVAFAFFNSRKDIYYYYLQLFSEIIIQLTPCILNNNNKGRWSVYRALKKIKEYLILKFISEALLAVLRHLTSGLPQSFSDRWYIRKLLW